MRTTLTIDDDVKALIEHERNRTGESFRTVVNRLIRRGATGGESAKSAPVPLPLLPGKPTLDVSDVSALLATLDDERRAQRGLT
ncbi:MAG: hypothetical protein HY827_05030 [Actinobacteria bacterium]|nr:hypothetical protein [Actinomycetota bacterium]